MRASLVVSVACIAVACSSDPSSGGPGGAPPNGGGGASAETYAQAMCAYLEQCSPSSIRRFYGDVPTCVSQQSALLAPAFTSLGTTFTQAELDACLGPPGPRDCATFLDTPACAFRGTLPNGTACHYPHQCAGGSCLITGAAPCGTCADLVAEGGDCTNADCLPPLTCSSDTCVAKVQVEGAACSDSAPCASALACVDGTCRKPRAKGEPCDDEDFASAPCAIDLFCIPDAPGASKGTCAEIGYAKLGEPCGFDVSTHLTTACEASTCSAGSGGTCVRFLPEGMTCQTDGPRCANGLECVSSVCTNTAALACQ